jgi:hypothetical protein
MEEICERKYRPRQCMITSTFSKIISQIQNDTKKGELLKNPTKIEEIQEIKFIDRS